MAARSSSVGWKAPRPGSSSSAASLPPSRWMQASRPTAVYRAILSCPRSRGGELRVGRLGDPFPAEPCGQTSSPSARARGGVLAACEAPSHRPATTEIEQPPLNERDLSGGLDPGGRSDIGRRCGSTPSRPGQAVAVLSAPVRTVCASTSARRPGSTPGGLYGRGEGAYEQTLAMFGVAENLLQQAGMEFGDVVRTWIYLREMDRDYEDLNRARRDVLRSARHRPGFQPAPASAPGRFPLGARSLHGCVRRPDRTPRPCGP